MITMIHSYGEEGAMTHYEVLNASPASTLEEIRVCYRAALLSVHPDKLGSRSSQRASSGSGADGEEDAAKGASSRYLRVQKAWNVLRDAESRARYDAAVKGLRGGVGGKGGDADVVVGEEVVLEDMEECESEAGDLEYWYPCRCSDFFVVGSKELQNAGLGFGRKSSSGAFSGAAEGDGGDGVHWDRQRQSIVLPCGSCSLHLRVSSPAPPGSLLYTSFLTREEGRKWSVEKKKGKWSVEEGEEGGDAGAHRHGGQLRHCYTARRHAQRMHC